MRSLSVKLTIAILAVVALGVLFVSALINLRTRQEFDRFLNASNSSQLVEDLEEQYALDGDWSNIEEVLRDSEEFEDELEHITIADESGRVVWGGEHYRAGQSLRPPDRSRAIPLSANGQPIGYLLTGDDDFGRRPGEDFSPEDEFVNRTGSFVGAAVLAVLFGGVLLSLFIGRTLSRPIRELTAAAGDLAGGELGRQVSVQSRDEIGQLGEAFNEMSAKLAASEETRRQMTADIAHDLRTPLSILGGYTEGLRDGTLDPKPEVLEMMDEEVEHLQHLVEDLRTLSLADAGKLRIERQAVDARHLLERSALAYAPQASAKGIEIKVDVAEGLDGLEVDAKRMTQVLNNLLENALRFTEQGSIELWAYRQGAGTVLEVRDSGAGIPQEEVGHIFDRFYRADISRQRGDAGSTGLGLAIARAIVEAHGGGIEVESVVGQGSSFKIHLP